MCVGEWTYGCRVYDVEWSYINNLCVGNLTYGVTVYVG